MSWVERILFYLVVGAVLALAANSAKAYTQLVFWDASACSGSGTVHVVISWTNHNCCGIPDDSVTQDMGQQNRIGNQQITGSYANSFGNLAVTFNGALAGSGDGSGAHPFLAAGANGCTPTCNNPVTVSAHWDGGAPHAAGAVVNAVVGGYLVQVQCDGFGCNAGSIPAAKLNLTGSAPWSVDSGVANGSWAICGVDGARYQTAVTLVGGPSTVDCGGSVDLAISAHCAAPTPTPTVSPSASVAPSPSTTPVLTPPPEPSPLSFSTPAPWTSPPPGMPGVDHASGTLTKADIYDAVKQAAQDAGKTGDWYGADGTFGYGGDPSGENGGAGNNLQSAVDRFTNDLSGSGDGLMEKVDAIDSLSLPTSIGDKSSWAVSLPVLGDLTIDLSTFDGPVWAFRSLCLAILVVGAWFAIVKIVRSGIA